MVSIVSGQGTGLFNTSRDLLGAAGELGRAQHGRNGERVTINAANGNLVIQDRDEHLVGLGQNLDVLRTYNSLATWDGDNGDGWRIGYYRRLQFDAAANVVRRIESDGGESAYAAIGNGLYRSTDGAGQFDVVSFDATTRTWTWVDASPIVFCDAAKGLALHRTEAQAGNAFEHLYYDAAGRRIGDVSPDLRRAPK